MIVLSQCASVAAQTPYDSYAPYDTYQPFTSAGGGYPAPDEYRYPIRLPPLEEIPAEEPEAAPAADDTPAVVEETEDERIWYAPTTWLLPVWEGSFEIGINGARGNSDTFSLNTGAKLKRKTEKSVWNLAFNHARATADDVSTANNSIGTIKYEKLFHESRWSLYASGMGEWDEFKAFDVRLVGNGGFGYKFIDIEHLKLKGRFGSGVSHEIGGPDDRYVPEANFGVDYEHKLTERQKLVATVDYFPEWGEFMDFRIVADASWQILLDEATNMNLKIGVIERYDSTPNGREPSDLTYTLLLLWKL